MKNTIASLIMLMPIIALANQTLMTEIESNNTWLKANYTSTSTDMTLKSGNLSQDVNSDTDSFSFEVIKAFDSGERTIPLLSLGFQNDDGNDSSVNTLSAKVGAKVALENDNNLVVFAGYDKSDDTDEVRSSIEAGLLFGKNTSSFYNEFSLTTSLPKNTSSIEGGNTVSIENSFKMVPEKNIVLTGIVGLSLISDLDIGNDTISYSPLFTFGAEAELFLNDNVSTALALQKGFGGGDAESSGVDVDLDLDVTLVQISLNARF